MTDDIIRETINEIEHGCDGLTYEIHKLIYDYFSGTNNSHKHSHPWLRQLTINMDYDDHKAVELMEGKELIMPTPMSRTIKLELRINEQKLKEAISGIKWQ